MRRNRTLVYQRKYNKYPDSYDRFMEPLEKGVMKKWRKLLCYKAKGKVLEVGVGTGANFPYYPPGVEIIGVDVSTQMLSVAERKLTMSKVPVELITANVQNLPFPNKTFDTVITAFVFCSVPDVFLGLQELERVTKNGGKLYFLEHVRSENYLLGLLMDGLNPLLNKYMGENINRKTEENIKLTGMKVEGVINLFGDIVKLIKVSPHKK